MPSAPLAAAAPAAPTLFPGLAGDRRAEDRRASVNRLRDADAPVHRWYRFVLSFPAHLVRRYLDEFGAGPGTVALDPFCGTGTTLVECRKRGVSAVGLEAMPMARFASRVKTDWTPAPEGLLRHAERVAVRARHLGERRNGRELRRLPEAARRLLIRDSISPRPLDRALALREAILEASDESDAAAEPGASPSGNAFTAHERLALAKTLVHDAGNLHFGPEVGVRGSREDAPVVDAWLGRVAETAADLDEVAGLGNGAGASVHHADARDPSCLEAESVDCVITSPPYPNEKDYSRTTRLETVVLGFAGDLAELRGQKQGLVRSNTRSVYRADDDHRFVEQDEEVQRLARLIEERRAELGKTSGFERNYHRVTLLYFGGMARHFAALRRVLRPGAQLAYVVGDQASYFRILIRTGEILARLAESLGYELVRTDLFRTRPATATGDDLREEVVVLRWPGPDPIRFESTRMTTRNEP